MQPDLSDITSLKHTTLFADFELPRLHNLVLKYPPRIWEYPEGKVIFLRGDPYEEPAILLRGKLDTEITDLEGTNLMVERLEAPEVVGLAVLFSETRRLPVTVSSATACRLAVFSRDQLVSIMKEEPAITMRVLQDAGDRILFLAEKIRFLHFGTIRQKIAAYLLDQLSLQHGGQQSIRQKGAITLELGYNREEMADLFGVSRPSLSRCFSELKESGILSFSGKRVRITEVDPLKAMLQQD
ncbi:MAG: Crp/Fnr family transcriptional regulator [Spirochaetales bacterium]|nr:Crp/Fnr family transcriptional regulator [Spirochaetales bacterium]MCF7938069.1 Crp/Fnr family transcriptional regulator [Spirochaetales bacterium]